MSHLESTMLRVDESLQKHDDDDIYTVLAMVPWARESVHTYIASHRLDNEKDLLIRIEEMLTSNLWRGRRSWAFLSKRSP